MRRREGTGESLSIPSFSFPTYLPLISEWDRPALAVLLTAELEMTSAGLRNRPLWALFHLPDLSLPSKEIT